MQTTFSRPQPVPWERAAPIFKPATGALERGINAFPLVVSHKRPLVHPDDHMTVSKCLEGNGWRIKKTPSPPCHLCATWDDHLSRLNRLVVFQNCTRYLSSPCSDRLSPKAQTTIIFSAQDNSEYRNQIPSREEAFSQQLLSSYRDCIFCHTIWAYWASVVNRAVKNYFVLKYYQYSKYIQIQYLTQRTEHQSPFSI